MHATLLWPTWQALALELGTNYLVFADTFGIFVQYRYFFCFLRLSRRQPLRKNFPDTSSSMSSIL